MEGDWCGNTRYLHHVSWNGLWGVKHLGNYLPKTASGYGRFNLAKFAYRPVSGERKSGIPAAVLRPAPVFVVVSLRDNPSQRQLE